MSRLQPLLLPDSLHKYTSPRNTRMCGYRLDSHVDSNVCIVELLEKICTCIRAWISMDCHADVLCSEEGHAHLCMCIASHFTHIHFLKHEQIFCICILLHTYSFNALCMYTHTHRTEGCVALKISEGYPHGNSNACVRRILQQMCTCRHALIKRRT